VTLAIRIAKTARSMFTTDAFKPLVANPAIDGVPDSASEDEWAKWVKDTSYVRGTYLHFDCMEY
jgi:hypothetical protein